MLRDCHCAIVVIVDVAFVCIGVLTKQMGMEKGLVHLLADYMPKGTAEEMGRLISVANGGTFVDHELGYASHVNEYKKRLKSSRSADPSMLPIVPKQLDQQQTHFKKVASAQYAREAYILQHEDCALWKRQHIASQGKQRVSLNRMGFRASGF